MASVQTLLHAASGLSSPDSRRDAEILLCHCLKKNRAWLYTWPEREVDSLAQQAYSKLLAARADGAPIAYLVGSREFWSLTLEVNQHTLIPRPETEALVAWALELPLPDDAAILDLGTGSGAIALALASERKNWRITGLDASAEALAVARRNAVSLKLARVGFVRSDWYSAIPAQRFHLLVSNPPYIEESDGHLSRGDLPFEPLAALVAPDGGLADLKRIVVGARAHLYPGGRLLLEHGFSQGAQVRLLLGSGGFEQVHTRCDIAGLERVSGGVLAC